MRVLVVGAGVIGQVYAGRLASAGHAITILARGATADVLRTHGIRLDGPGSGSDDVTVTETPPRGSFDAVLVAVRLDQVDAVLSLLDRIDTDRIVTLCNAPDGGAGLSRWLGRRRTVLAFPGVGGRRTHDGIIRYTEVRQQATTIGRTDGREDAIVGALRGADFAVDVADDMPAWLCTHAIFIVGVGAAILLTAGDSKKLAADRAAVARMMEAVADGFHSLKRQGIRPTPLPLRMIFTSVPRTISVPYWRRQLRGDTGTVAIAPHVRVTRDTELPAVVSGIRRLVGSSAPRLEALLRDAHL